MLDDARAACAALPAGRRRPRGLHGTARARHGARLQRRRRRGPADPARRGRDGRPTTGLLDGPPLMWRWALEAPLFLREARTARESFGRALTAARERGVAGALSPLLYLLARDAATTDRWPEARAQLLRGRRARPPHRSAGRGVRRALGPRLARGARGARGELPRARRGGARARPRATGAASTRPGRSPRSATSSSRSGVRPRPSSASPT